MKQEIVDSMNLEGIPDVVQRRFGITVKRGNLRLFPTSIPGYSDTVWEIDYFQPGGIYGAYPVSIIYKSVDGNFLYVESAIGRGWIAAGDIAVAEREEIRMLTEDTDFLMATGHKVPIYGDSSFKSFIRYFYFSSTIPLVKHDRKGYVVKIPYRKTDGSLGVANGYVKPGADVHIGYLPYTKRNVITQIFKLLNQPYGWGEILNNRDCSGTMRVLLRCFGIIAGKGPSFILSASDHRVYINPDLSVEEKMAEVAKIEPVITMAGTDGHIVLYLGKAHNGKLYFIHQGGWGYDEGDQHFIVNRVTVNSAEHKWYDINEPKVFTTMRE